MKINTAPLRPRCYRSRAAGVAVTACVLMLLAAPADAANLVITNQLPDSGWFVDMNRFSRSAHSGFECQDCHGTMQEGGAIHPDPEHPDFLKKPAFERYDYSRCRACHRLAYDRYMAGGHAEARQKRIADRTAAESRASAETAAPPTCGHCHASHYDRSGLERVEVGKRMVVTCGRCHPDHTGSYLDNIHGKLGVYLENPASAFCTDCHGAHTVVSLKNRGDALPVCRRCHPEAHEGFADVVIHATMSSAPAEGAPKSESLLWINRVKWAAIGMVALSLIFFFGHGFLWLLREIHEKMRKG